MSNLTLPGNMLFELEMDYWKDRLKDIKPLDLFTDYARPGVQNTNKASINFFIEESINKQLIELSELNNVTLFVTLLTAYKVLLYRYSNQEDICIGNVGLNSHYDSKTKYFVNTLILRTEINGNDHFEELLQRVNSSLADAYDHLKVPFEKVADSIIKDQDLTMNALVRAMFIFQNEPSLKDDILTGHTPQSDITFILKEKGSGLRGIVEYSTDLYKEETINHIIDHYKVLLNSILTNPKKSIGSLPILSKTEEHKLLYEFNNTKVKYSKDKTIVDLFEEQVEKIPDNRAVIFDNKELSYNELNIRSNQLADYLRKTYQIKPDDLVGIMLERSEWMIVVIFGILKAGGAYVPIAPDYPQERINYLVQDSGCKVLIDNEELEKFKKLRGEYSPDNQSVGLQPHNLAYCIYTSGSTGNPKGCLLQHTGLVNRLEWMQKAYPLTANDVILQKTTFSFDVSVWELIWWAIEGASVCMLQPGGEKSPEVIVDTIEKYKATVIHFVPSMLSVFLEYLESDKTKLNQLKELKQVFTSGEALTLNQAERFNELFSNTALMNLYGPTEASIDVTYFDCKKENLGNTVPIGKPIDNTQIYIVDKFRNLLPAGAAGEICLGGVGLARGYLNRPELTAEKFIKNPFVEGERIYRTGDLGKWRPDGNIEYLGRIDDQVKIRGFRIELDEITSVLQRHAKVKDAVVIVRAIKDQDKELIAYTTGDAEAIELRDYLKKQLPSYMVPGYYVHMESIPLTSNGKADRKALPIPDGSGINEVAYVAPSTDTEKTLVKIWAEVLGMPEETIGVKSNFFDLGGHSIKAIRLRGLVHKVLGVKLPLKELFSESTLEQQAFVITKKDLKTYEAIEVIQEQPDYKLSSAQRRLWILNHFEGTESAYNIPYVILLEGSLDKPSLKKAFEAMTVRHEILRTVFKEDKTGTPRQYIISADLYTFKLKETDLRKTAGSHAMLNQLVDQDSFDGFDFEEGPLWRCHLIQLENNKHILVMVHHHIISDGWSMDIFRKEWCALYNAYSDGKSPNLPLLRIQYKDYAAWHTTQLESEDLMPHKDYWIKQFEGDIPILELPADKVRPDIKTFNGASLTTTIDNEALERLNKAGKALGGTLFMSLLACVNTLFYRYTGQEDIIIGSPIAGREHPDLEEQIGFYINTLALRTRFSGTGSFEDLFQHIKEVTLNAYEHQLYPYDELVDALKLPRNINRNPLFDVMVVLQNAMEQDAEFTLKGLQTSICEVGEYKVAKFDINFIFSESKRGLDLFLEYNTDIYSAEQMQRMLKHFENIMTSVVNDPKQNLALIDFLTSDEKRQLLYEFNNTLVDYPKKKNLCDLFEEQASKTPDAIAVRQHDQTMSYRELNESANQLAGYLVKHGVNIGDNIGLLVTRGFNMIIGMFGILKAGGAYVPIDPEYPIDRQEYILQNSSVTKVVADGDYPLEELTSPNLFVKIKTLDLNAYNSDNPGLEIDSKQLAYTIYTSGSTGRPKGVMIEHHMAVNLVLWVNTEFNIGPDDRLLFITSMCFDLSVYDIFGILSSGGSLVIVEQSELMDVPRLKDMMIQDKITFWDSVPTTMDYLVRELEAHDTGYLQETLRVVFMSGDWIPVNLPNRIKKYFPKTQVISLGGATEGTVWSNFYPVKQVDSKWSSIPYGRPMNNNFFYILNEQLQPVPIGVTGELYIGGVGVARGYANDKEKTDYAFVKDPFNDQAGGRMYKTGDLGRMLPDLNMEFIGRKDDQVKIRGYRIELGEIESVLRQCELVSQAVVLAKADKEKKKRLVGYVVGKENYDRATVIRFLKSKLPDYMVPTLWVELDSIPLTSNGKIDKKKLPEFDTEEQIKEQYIAPRTESEKILVNIWEEVFKINNIGINHDFFDLGGHSLMAVQIVNQIKQRTGKILPISILFKHSNIESLNTFLNGNKTEKEFRSLVPIKPSGNKMPIYFVHGVGLNVMNFADLATYLDREQPVFGLQALGLGGKFPSISTMSEIAKIYISEIIEQNPTGPYAIAGYSLGGFIAVEMRRQFELMNKEVKVLAILDTFADYTDDFIVLFPKKLKKHLNKWIKLSLSFIRQPAKTIQEQKSINLEEKQYRLDAVKLAKESGDKEYYELLKHVRDVYYDTLRKSGIIPFDDFVYLFRASECDHYTNDKKYLGWRKYALKGVKEYLIPGDHRTMLLKPNVEQFASVLQEVLDNSK
jgi:amino acid adenylation domain-containing protein